LRHGFGINAVASGVRLNSFSATRNFNYIDLRRRGVGEAQLVERMSALNITRIHILIAA
jgi:hypothetical protein